MSIQSGDSTAKYRPDIDGLRAIAVIPVILFHAGFSGFSGGYVGVDVFFVISGYLITSLILPEVIAGNFSIARFYERRIRRIFPALFSVLLASLAVSYWIMSPQNFRILGRSVVATTAFVSNILFWRYSGYFDVPSEEVPLLHTWSLSVEEQFYIFFPVYLLVVGRRFPSALKPLTIAIAVLSFGISVYGAMHKPVAAFYLAPSRAWELLLGALLAMGTFPVIRSPKLQNLISLAGLLLIVLAVVSFSKSSPFPGLYALAPAVGAFFVAYAGKDNWVNNLLSIRPLVFCGLISYSLYLWHWPFLVLADHYLMRGHTRSEALVIIALTVPLSILSWKFIEQPFRGKGVLASRWKLFATAGAVMLIIGVCGWAVYVTGGWPRRVPPEARRLASVALDCLPPRDYCNSPVPKNVRLETLCQFGAVNVAKPDFILWGDSHAEFMKDGFSQAAILVGRAGWQATSEGCPPLLGMSRREPQYSHCRDLSDAIFKAVADPSVRQVILAARWGMWSEGSRYLYEFGPAVMPYDDQSLPNEKNYREVLRRGLKRTLDALRPLQKHITVVGPTPEVGWNVPSVLSMQAWHGRIIHSEPRLSEFLKRNQFALELLREFQQVYGFDLIFPHQVFCDKENCRVMIAGGIIYCDDDHLSQYGQSLLVPLFEKSLQSVLGQPKLLAH